MTLKPRRFSVKFKPPALARQIAFSGLPPAAFYPFPENELDRSARTDTVWFCRLRLAPSTSALIGLCRGARAAFVKLGRF